ncbi:MULTISPECIES: hypothetical protein [Halorussus]|uniref:hypothetical protein n=1 Tax=Halorussus TaxID=1070314 RepID=UPI00209DBA3D|nr:hypothetical protein [Halorussus vallis]USZ74714.1 hypothetical protein NGM07_14870 [Halorussus vallis]
MFERGSLLGGLTASVAAVVVAAAVARLAGLSEPSATLESVVLFVSSFPGAFLAGFVRSSGERAGATAGFVVSYLFFVVPTVFRLLTDGGLFAVVRAGDSTLVAAVFVPGMGLTVALALVVAVPLAVGGSVAGAAGGYVRRRRRFGRP